MFKLDRICWSLFVFIIISSKSFALDLPESMKQSMSQDVVGLPSLLNLVVSMAVVIMLIYFTGWVYSKLNVINKDKLKNIANKTGDTHRFTVLQSMPLGQQRHLYSIEMNGKVLLVGSTPEQINLIKEFDNSADCSDKLTEDLTENTSASIENKSVDIDELYKKYKKQ